MATGNNDYGRYTLASDVVAGVALSDAGEVAYATTTGGDLQVFDLASHTLLNSWHVGRTLGGVTAAPDGSFVLAIERYPSGKAVLYRIDTATGAKQTLSQPGRSFSDVQIIDQHSAIVSGGDKGVQKLNLDTMTFSPLPSAQSYDGRSIISQDGHLTLLAETTTTDGPLFLYDNRLNQVVSVGSLGVINSGAQAISEAAGQIAIFDYPYSLNIYDLSLHLQRQVNFHHDIGGVAYDQTGDYAYVAIDGVIGKYETTTWTMVDSFDGGEPAGYTDSRSGDTLLLDSSGSRLTYLTQTGDLVEIDLTVRNDTVTGTPGADTMAAGVGDDTYLVNNRADAIVEAVHGGADTVRSSIDYTLAPNVENLELLKGALSGTGNKADNRMTGNGSDNALDGAGGSDTLIGGAGDDHLFGAIGSDLLVGGLGADTLDGSDGSDTASYAGAAQNVKVQLGVSGAQDTRGGGVDTLISIENLAGSSYGDLLRGDARANWLDGADGDDVLVGGQGADTLQGGAGADIFRYSKLADSRPDQADLIFDLNPGDTIDLQLIDADTTRTGNQSFSLVDAFTHHAAEAVMTGPIYGAAGPTTTLALDVNGDGVADMTILMRGDQTGFTGLVL